jgi:hypothetical protein
MFKLNHFSLLFAQATGAGTARKRALGGLDCIEGRRRHMKEERGLGIRIRGTGIYVPGEPISNAELKR